MPKFTLEDKDTSVVLKGELVLTGDSNLTLDLTNTKTGGTNGILSITSEGKLTIYALESTWAKEANIDTDSKGRIRLH